MKLLNLAFLVIIQFQSLVEGHKECKPILTKELCEKVLHHGEPYAFDVPNHNPQVDASALISPTITVTVHHAELGTDQHRHHLKKLKPKDKSNTHTDEKPKAPKDDKHPEEKHGKSNEKHPEEKHGKPNDKHPEEKHGKPNDKHPEEKHGKLNDKHPEEKHGKLNDKHHEENHKKSKDGHSDGKPKPKDEKHHDEKHHDEKHHSDKHKPTDNHPEPSKKAKALEAHPHSKNEHPPKPVVHVEHAPESHHKHKEGDKAKKADKPTKNTSEEKVKAEKQPLKPKEAKKKSFKQLLKLIDEYRKDPGIHCQELNKEVERIHLGEKILGCPGEKSAHKKAKADAHPNPHVVPLPPHPPAVVPVAHQKVEVPHKSEVNVHPPESSHQVHPVHPVEPIAHPSPVPAHSIAHHPPPAHVNPETAHNVHPPTPHNHSPATPVHPSAPQVHPSAPQVHPSAPHEHPQEPHNHPKTPQDHPKTPQTHPIQKDHVVKQRVDEKLRKLKIVKKLSSNCKTEKPIVEIHKEKGHGKTMHIQQEVHCDHHLDATIQVSKVGKKTPTKEVEKAGKSDLGHAKKLQKLLKELTETYNRWYQKHHPHGPTTIVHHPHEPTQK